MARPKTAAPYQPVTLRFPKDILEQCRLHALHEDRSLNEQVMHIVKAWLKEQPAMRGNHHESHRPSST